MNEEAIKNVREDFMHDVYNTLDFLPTNEEANRIIDSFDRVISSIEQQPSEDCISREEAINCCRNEWEEEVKERLRTLPPVTPSNADIREAYIKGYDYGVKDWFKNKTQPCEDCISREYIEPIVEELENICINGDEHILSLLSNIKNAPPVTPQPKVGKWIKVDPLRTGNEAYIYVRGM